MAESHLFMDKNGHIRRYWSSEVAAHLVFIGGPRDGFEIVKRGHADRLVPEAEIRFPLMPIFRWDDYRDSEKGLPFEHATYRFIGCDGDAKWEWLYEWTGE